MEIVKWNENKWSENRWKWITVGRVGLAGGVGVAAAGRRHSGFHRRFALVRALQRHLLGKQRQSADK